MYKTFGGLIHYTGVSICITSLRMFGPLQNTTFVNNTLREVSECLLSLLVSLLLLLLLITSIPQDVYNLVEDLRTTFDNDTSLKSKLKKWSILVTGVRITLLGEMSFLR